MYQWCALFPELGLLGSWANAAACQAGFKVVEHVPGEERLVGCQDGGDFWDGREKDASFQKKTRLPHLFHCPGAAGGGTGSPAEIGLLVLAENVRLSL